MNDRSWLKSQNYEGRYPCSFVLDVDVVPTSVSVILRRGTFVNSDKFRTYRIPSTHVARETLVTHLVLAWCS
jgi:hypothetical protein